MQFNRCFWVIVTCLMLFACAGPRIAQDLQAGKASFQSGDYKVAFRQLLPLAVKGKPEAQYAVGYMYYYGYGVPEDNESGIFWMTRAADQHYLPAERALQLINHPTPESESFIPVRQSSIQENQRAETARIIQKTREEHLQNDPVTTTNNKISFAEPQPQRAEQPVKVATAKATQDQSVSLPAPRKYALQLYGSYHLNSVKDLQSQLRLKNTGHIYQTTHEGKDWYVLTFGNFITAHEASATKNNLPSELKQMHPWVRGVNDLHLV